MNMIKMSLRYIAYLAFAALVVNSNVLAYDAFYNDDLIVSNSECVNVTANECNQNQYWVSKTKYSCCNQCIDCDESYCSKVPKCLPVKSDDCGDGYKYHPRDPNTCKCCSYCEKCDPIECKMSLCKDMEKSCKWNEIYLPGDGLCDCCGKCKKVKCDPKRCLGSVMEDCKHNEMYVNPNGICSCGEGRCTKNPDFITNYIK